jgi:hypothetical protein
MMTPARRALSALLAALLPALHAPAQADESQVRAALAACVEAWNGHRPKAFGDACLTEDIWFSESDDSFYKRFQGREKVLAASGYSIENADLQWDVVRVQAQPDGTFAVQLKQRMGMLPRTEGRYASVFDSDPSFARLRREGGAWKVFFFTSHKGWAQALWQALDEPAAASPATPPVPVAAALPSVPGTEPEAYTRQYGSRSMSCFHCHGRRPIVSEDGDRGRIIAAGAAADSPAALRRAMTTPRAGGMMNNALADPALDDAQLDAIRWWLRALRDGRGERSAGRVAILNDRSDRDPPARLALLRAEGGWKPPGGSGCRQGMVLKGGTRCEIRVPEGARGALVFRFAASQGLQPEEVRLTLDER